MPSPIASSPYTPLYGQSAHMAIDPAGPVSVPRPAMELTWSPLLAFHMEQPSMFHGSNSSAASLYITDDICVVKNALDFGKDGTIPVTAIVKAHQQKYRRIRDADEFNAQRWKTMFQKYFKTHTFPAFKIIMPSRPASWWLRNIAMAFSSSDAQVAALARFGNVPEGTFGSRDELAMYRDGFTVKEREVRYRKLVGKLKVELLQSEELNPNLLTQKEVATLINDQVIFPGELESLGYHVVGWKRKWDRPAGDPAVTCKRARTNGEALMGKQQYQDRGHSRIVVNCTTRYASYEDEQQEHLQPHVDKGGSACNTNNHDTRVETATAMRRQLHGQVQHGAVDMNANLAGFASESTAKRHQIAEKNLQQEKKRKTEHAAAHAASAMLAGTHAVKIIQGNRNVTSDYIERNAEGGAGVPGPRHAEHAWGDYENNQPGYKRHKGADPTPAEFANMEKKLLSLRALPNLHSASAPPVIFEDHVHKVSRVFVEWKGARNKKGRFHFMVEAICLEGTHKNKPFHIPLPTFNKLKKATPEELAEATDLCENEDGDDAGATTDDGYNSEHTEPYKSDNGGDNSDDDTNKLLQP